MNPQVLIWARETAGLAPDDAAKKIGLSGKNAADRLVEMERGRIDPSRRQLVEMSRVYRRPLLAFYLPVPPDAGIRTQDFRTLPNPEEAPEGILEAIIRDVRARQALVRSALEDAEEAEPLSFVGSISTLPTVEALSAALLDVWDFDIRRFRMARSADDAFKLLREKVEASGVFVVLMGNAGHHSTNLSPRIFRGFVLADPIAPFVVINETDSRSSWSFTLLHELGHVLLGQSAISGYDSEAQIEKLCDKAAARVLLDGVNLTLDSATKSSPDLLLTSVGLLAKDLNVSRKMIAYNLLAAGQISFRVYASLSDLLDEERLATRVAKTSEGGADYYVVRRHRVGNGLIRLVGRMVDGGSLTSTKAGRVLGVKPTAVSRMTSNQAA